MLMTKVIHCQHADVCVCSLKRSIPAFPDEVTDDGVPRGWGRTDCNIVNFSDFALTFAE